jgi:hypothetical protein
MTVESRELACALVRTDMLIRRARDQREWNEMFRLKEERERIRDQRMRVLRQDWLEHRLGQVQHAAEATA